MAPMPKFIVVGDRLFTDVLMANRFGPSKALAVWTTGLWVKEALILRRLERTFLDLVLKYRRTPAPTTDYAQFIKEEPPQSNTLTSPRADYAKYPLIAVRGAWYGVRYAVAKATESKQGRASRKAEENRINAILSVDAHPPAKGILNWTAVSNALRGRISKPLSE